MINQLREYIWQIANTERQYPHRKVDLNQMLNLLNQYNTKNPFPPEPISNKTDSLLQKGIRCSQCNSFDLDTRKLYIHSKCGMHEPRENAISRTICEYGVIHFDKDLVITDIVNFFNGDYSRGTIVGNLSGLRILYNELRRDSLVTGWPPSLHRLQVLPKVPHCQGR